MFAIPLCSNIHEISRMKPDTINWKVQRGKIQFVQGLPFVPYKKIVIDVCELMNAR